MRNGAQGGVGGAAVVHDVGQITADFPQGGEQPVLHTLQYCKFILKIKVKSGAGYTAYLADAGNAYAVDTVPLVNFQKGGFNILNSALAVQRPAGGGISINCLSLEIKEGLRICCKIGGTLLKLLLYLTKNKIATKNRRGMDTLPPFVQLLYGRFLCDVYK